MADALTDRILDSARSRLPGAIDSQVYFELTDVLNDFFRTSTCWRETTTVQIEDGVDQYELFTEDLPARVVTLISVKNANGDTIPATMLNPNVLKLYRNPEPGEYTISVILTVANNVNDEMYPRFPQWVSDTYGDVIADGVVGRMSAMPAKPYSSPNHAAFYTRKFKAGALSARINTNRENLMGGQRWQFPQFAAQNRGRL